MLRLSKLTDYAIVIACFGAREPEAMHSAAEIAQAIGLALPTVQKILKRLTQAGIFHSERGAHGGYRLARPPKTINIAQIIAAMEGPIGLTECTLAENHCRQAEDCDIRGNWALINRAIQTALEAVSLADMVRPAPQEVSISLSGLRSAAR